MLLLLLSSDITTIIIIIVIIINIDKLAKCQTDKHSARGRERERQTTS